MLSSNMESPQQLTRAVALLFSRVPDFVAARSQDLSFLSHGRDDSPYLVFGDFGLFLLQQLDNREISRTDFKWLRPSFALIDEMLTSDDPELVNLIQVGVLEVLSDRPYTIGLVKNYLSAFGQQRLEEWLKSSQNS